MNEVISREDLEAMSKEDLIAECNVRYGLNVNKNFNKAELVQMFIRSQAEHRGNTKIAIDRENVAEVPRGYVKIVLQPGKYNPKGRPVFASHNFRPFTVPVNVPVIMPEAYLNCFSDAVKDEYRQDEISGEFVSQDEHSYPFSVLERGA